MKCPHCGKMIKLPDPAIELGRLGGLATTEAKIAASRENGKKGGRPRNKDT